MLDKDCSTAGPDTTAPAAVNVLGSKKLQTFVDGLKVVSDSNASGAT
jgi:hypothetical protein